MLRRLLTVTVALCSMTEMNDDKLPDFLRGSYEGSFAYKTITERLPVILTKVIDLICREKSDIIAGSENSEQAAEQLKQACGQLSELKSSMQRNHALQLLSGSAADINSWNEALHQAAEGEGTEGGGSECCRQRFWFSAPWLLVECYMYRKIKQIMDESVVLASYDYFAEQKRAALSGSLRAADLAALHLTTALPLTVQSPQLCDDMPARQRLIIEFLAMSLWANKNDLSLSAGSQVVQLESPLTQVTSLAAHVLVNDSQLAFQLLDKLRARDHVQIDIVLDNAGFELFADLCLAHVLVEVGAAERVLLHVKMMPWYVSDASAADIEHLLHVMEEQSPSSSSSSLPLLAARWRELLRRDVWRVQTHWYWTSPHALTDMSCEAADLYKQLQSSSLLVFKGDLNYRKLLADRNWPHSTSFCSALQQFRPSSVLALRTLKADLIAGLPAAQETLASSRDPHWMTNGQWAVVQLCPSP